MKRLLIPDEATVIRFTRGQVILRTPRDNWGFVVLDVHDVERNARARESG